VAGEDVVRALSTDRRVRARFGKRTAAYGARRAGRQERARRRVPAQHVAVQAT
jgi:hypothetical protein